MSTIKVLKIFHSHNFFNGFLTPNSRYYKAGECSDSYLFGLYMNGFPVTEVDSPESSWTSVLRLFDWDGQLRYESDLGAKIRLIAVDDKQQYLYGVTEDDAIVRYDLSVLSE